MDSNFSFLIAMKQCEFSLLCDYVGKSEANQILQQFLADLDTISATPIKSLTDIQSPDEYALILGKLVESRKKYQFRHRQVSTKLKETLTELCADIGQDTVSDRIKNWLTKYNTANDKQCKKIYEITDITILEKLLQQVIESKSKVAS